MRKLRFEYAQPGTTFSCNTQLRVLIRSLLCRYKPFLVAEVTLNDPKQSEGGNIDPADSDKGAAFKQLAGFLGEKNDRGQGLSMTTPVFNKSKQGVMQFYIGEGYKVRPPAKNVPTHAVCCQSHWGLCSAGLLIGMSV